MAGYAFLIYCFYCFYLHFLWMQLMRDLHDMTILVVDDDKLVLKYLSLLLKREGYNSVITADSGALGLELLKNRRPDLILQDIMMPDMDGFECCRHVRANELDNRVPIIVMTAMTHDDALARSIDAGATDFVSKPIRSFEILSRIRSALTLKQSFDHMEEELMKRKQAEERIRQQNELLRNAYDEIESLYQRLQRDYEIAGEVFIRVAPADHSGFPNIRSISAPASIVGGDLLLLAPRPSGGMHLLLGDFTGHGLSAALGAIPVADIFHRMSENDYPISEIIEEMNRRLRAILPTGLFFCACFVALNSTYDTLTVWNGGMPDVLLVGAQGGIKKRFSSTNLPLGVVETERLVTKGQVVHVAKGDLAYVYSDGIIEVRNPQGVMYGQECFERSFDCGVDPGALFDKVANAFMLFQEGSPRTDDFILAEIKCGTTEGWAVSRTHGSESMSPRWKMSLEMGPENLRSDPLRLVEKMLMEAWELRKHKEDIYLILAELFSNALDYGVLGLDGAMKKSPEGFDEFFSLRQKALETLETGWVNIEVEFTPHPDELVLSIRVEDSGPGFDHSFIGECAFSENITCRGRGIQLLGSMCKSLRYNEKGNCVEAVYAC